MSITQGRLHYCCLFFLLFIVITAFRHTTPDQTAAPYVLVLGIAQDGGYPQAGCKRNCCKAAWENDARKRLVSSLALIDPVSGGRWLFDATPDLKEQLHRLQELAGPDTISGIFLTHGHIGHYTGLMELGREAMGAKDVPVYVMPRMKDFLAKNGPWSQLVSLGNISLKPMVNDSAIKLNDRISVTPFLVPHRDEFTETVGYRISCNGKTVVFIPDIDKWEKWQTGITGLIKKSDVLFLDGTFFQDGELPGVDMSKIPHPFVSESMQMFSSLPEADRAKVHFIHFNHTNPVLDEGSEQYKQVLRAGYKIAQEQQAIEF